MIFLLVDCIVVTNMETRGNPYWWDFTIIHNLVVVILFLFLYNCLLAHYLLVRNLATWCIMSISRSSCCWWWLSTTKEDDQRLVIFYIPDVLYESGTGILLTVNAAARGGFVKIFTFVIRCQESLHAEAGKEKTSSDNWGRSTVH